MKALIHAVAIVAALSLVALCAGIIYEYGRIDQSAHDIKCLQTDAIWADLSGCIGSAKP